MQKLIHSLFILLWMVGLYSCGSEDNGVWSQNANTAHSIDSSTTPMEVPKPAVDKSLTDLIADYDPPNRELWQKPQLVIEKMGDLSDKTVADIGSGSGSFARRLAQSAQRVIAIEIDPRFIEYMDSIKRVELSETYQQRFETRLATPTDSKLQKEEVDIVILVNTYLYLADRPEYLIHLKEKLPKGGKIVIVDFKKKRIPIRNPAQRYRVPLFEVEKELQQVGFTNITSDDRSLDYQYIIMAEK